MSGPMPFERWILNLVDAHDKFGLLANKSREEKLRRAFLLDPAKAKDTGAPCGTDSGPVRRQAELFFRAVAMATDMRSGVPVASIVETDDEGFGRAVVYSGRLVLVSRAWRQGRFGFTAMEEANAEGERLVEAGLRFLERYPDVARLEE